MIPYLQYIARYPLSNMKNSQQIWTLYLIFRTLVNTQTKKEVDFHVHIVIMNKLDFIDIA